MRRGRRKKPASVPRPAPAGALLRALLCIIALTPAASFGQTVDLVDRSALRVCADPANMPFSNDKGQGFENKIAELLGQQAGRAGRLHVVPASNRVRTEHVGRTEMRRGHRLPARRRAGAEHQRLLSVRLRARHPRGSPLAGVETLDDPRLQGKSIGVIARTPPVTIMALNGLLATAKSFQLVVDRRYSSPAEEMMAAIISGELDAGVLWGPVGGYYAKLSPVPMSVVPLAKETKGPRMAFRITMGIRSGEPDWKHQLNDLIAASQNEINAILLDFGVPILTENDQKIRR